MSIAAVRGLGAVTHAMENEIVRAVRVLTRHKAALEREFHINMKGRGNHHHHQLQQHNPPHPQKARNKVIHAHADASDSGSFMATSLSPFGSSTRSVMMCNAPSSPKSTVTVGEASVSFLSSQSLVGSPRSRASQQQQGNAAYTEREQAVAASVLLLSTLATEVRRVHSMVDAFERIENRIIQREATWAKLVGWLQGPTTGASSSDRSLQNAIKHIQRYSADVVEDIALWQQAHGTQATTFIWNGMPYLLWMRRCGDALRGNRLALKNPLITRAMLATPFLFSVPEFEKLVSTYKNSQETLSAGRLLRVLHQYETLVAQSEIEFEESEKALAELGRSPSSSPRPQVAGRSVTSCLAQARMRDANVAAPAAPPGSWRQNGSVVECHEEDGDGATTCTTQGEAVTTEIAADAAQAATIDDIDVDWHQDGEDGGDVNQALSRPREGSLLRESLDRALSMGAHYAEQQPEDVVEAFNNTRSTVVTSITLSADPSSRSYDDDVMDEAEAAHVLTSAVVRHAYLRRRKRVIYEKSNADRIGVGADAVLTASERQKRERDAASTRQMQLDIERERCLQAHRETAARSIQTFWKAYATLLRPARVLKAELRRQRLRAHAASVILGHWRQRRFIREISHPFRLHVNHARFVCSAQHRRAKALTLEKTLGYALQSAARAFLSRQLVGYRARADAHRRRIHAAAIICCAFKTWHSISGLCVSKELHNAAIARQRRGEMLLSCVHRIQRWWRRNVAVVLTTSKSTQVASVLDVVGPRARAARSIQGAWASHCTRRGVCEEAQKVESRQTESRVRGELILSATVRLQSLFRRIIARHVYLERLTQRKKFLARQVPSAAERYRRLQMDTARLQKLCDEYVSSLPHRNIGDGRMTNGSCCGSRSTTPRQPLVVLSSSTNVVEKL
eukprot:PhM_4_TR12757/c0_g2_i1/m.28114